jgi:hypothetical protein
MHNDSMDNNIIETLSSCETLVTRIADSVSNLNSLLQSASKQGLYILINKEEIDVGGKTLQHKITIAHASYTTVFVKSAT